MSTMKSDAGDVGQSMGIVVKMGFSAWNLGVNNVNHEKGLQKERNEMGCHGQSR